MKALDLRGELLVLREMKQLHIQDEVPSCMVHVRNQRPIAPSSKLYHLWMARMMLEIPWFPTPFPLLVCCLQNCMSYCKDSHKVDLIVHQNSGHDCCETTAGL